MNGVNKAIIMGNLGAEPEVRYTNAGEPVATLRIATTERWKDKEGQKREATEWHRVVLFGKPAEIAGKYLHKGEPVYIEGKIRTRKWQDKDGADRYTTEIVGDNIQLLGRGTGPGEQADGNEQVEDRRAPVEHQRKTTAPPPAVKPRGSAAGKGDGGTAGMPDDIPF